jgi:UDP-glucose 6-dehydrogenase
MTTPMTPINGNGKAQWWIVGLLTTIVLSAAGHTITSVQRDGERIAVLETQTQDVREQLKRISNKLDQLLEQRRP